MSEKYDARNTCKLMIGKVSENVWKLKFCPQNLILLIADSCNVHIGNHFCLRDSGFCNIVDNVLVDVFMAFVNVKQVPTLHMSQGMGDNKSGSIWTGASNNGAKGQGTNEQIRHRQISWDPPFKAWVFSLLPHCLLQCLSVYLKYDWIQRVFDDKRKYNVSLQYVNTLF